MARVIVARHGDPASVSQMAEAVEGANPGYRLSAGAWAGDREAAPEQRGVRYLWVLDGEGEAFLPAGYRTQEGDGAPLPDVYRTDPLPGADAGHLAALRQAIEQGAVHPVVRDPLAALCARQTAQGYRGDIAGDLWRLLESGLAPEAWAAGARARCALVWFFHRCAEVGWSTKTVGGWERLLAGDQVVCTAARPARLRGRFRYWAIEDTGATSLPCSAVRRLRYLRDTAGGCSPGFDAFRRLHVTWQPTAASRQRIAAALAGAARASGEGEPAPGGAARASGEGDPAPGGAARAPGSPAPGGDADAPNRLNSHVLHIEAAQSRTHFHPAAAVGGGRPQSEFYFALDPSAYGLRAPGGTTPRLIVFPDVPEWRRYEVVDCAPGVAVFMPPDTGHRGVDVFASIVTIPGFKPGNEIYVDRLIRLRGGAPYNASAA